MSEQVPEIELESGGWLRPGDRIGPYIYQRALAAGGMAHVVLATDPSGQIVALKVLKAHRVSSGLARFRREFRALSRIFHENVIRVEAYGDIHGHPYIAMEYVEGIDLHEEIKRYRDLEAPERFARITSVLGDLARALAYIHKRGLIHRDLKPSNILLDREGRCKLSDFGIVKDLDPASNDPFVSTTLVGTWAYASPEQLRGDPLDHRSDLYSLGVMLYAMLTQRRPFAARDLAGYLTAHRDYQPMPPRQLDPDIPAHLEDICLRLLEKAPRDRFQSASEILARLEPEEATAELELEAAIWEPPLVGRQAEMDLLRDAIGALTRGRGGAMLIEGGEGAGRTRLFQEALRYAAGLGLAVHSARLAAADGAYESLLRVAQGIAAELGPKVPPELTHATLGFVRGRGRLTGDLRYQLYDGVRVALDTLLQNGPVVLALDDLHHAPPPMVALLSYLMRTLVSRDEQPLLLLATARLDVTAPALVHVRDGSELGLPPTRISLQPLTAEHIRSLLGQMGLDPARATEQALKLAEQTAGNPFYMAEYLRARFAPGSPVEGSTEELPAGLRQLVLSRLAGLGRAERAILELLAVAARELDLDVLLELVEEGEEEALDRLEGLRAQGLVVERRAALSTVFELAQPRMGLAIAAELAPAAAQRLHLRLADALAASQGSNPLAAEAIGAHYRLAGDPARAWRYYAKAAIGLGERSLLGEAWRLAERAAALEAEAQSRLDAETWRRLRPGLLRIRADALFNQGEWSPARDVLTLLLEASTQAGDPRLVDRAELDLATAQLRLDQREAGHARLREVLDRARQRHDWAVVIDALHRLAALAWEEGKLEATESLATEGLMLASGPELSASRAEILLALTAVQATRGQLQAAATGLREAQGILGDLRHKRTRGLCLSNLAEVLTWQGNLGEAIQHATTALGLAGEVLHREGEAFALRVRGTAWLDLGDDERASQDIDRSLALAGDRNAGGDEVATRTLAGRLALIRKDYHRALGHLRTAIKSARHSDPEEYGPAARALLARCWGRVGEGARCEEQLNHLEGRVGRLPLGRRLPVQLDMAVALGDLGRKDEALTLAIEVGQTALSRGFRLHAMHARLLVSGLGGGEAAQDARREAAELAQAMEAGLADDARPAWQKVAGGAW